MLTTATPASPNFPIAKSTFSGDASGMLRFRGQGAKPIRLEEHCTECGAPSCYVSCALFEAAQGVGCRRFVFGIGLSRTGTWTATSADLAFKSLGMLKAKLSGVTPAPTWNLGFLLQLEVFNHARVGFTAILDFTSYPWSPQLPQVRVPLVLHPGVSEIYVPPADLQHMAGSTAAQVSLSFPNEQPQLVRLHASHFVEGVLDASSRRVAPVKLLCTDLDGTVWDGFVDEVGAPPPLRSGVIESMHRIKARRMRLVAISSASQEAVSAHISGLGLDGLFDSVECEVVSKSERLELIREQYGYLRDEVVFVDDDAFEREEVGWRCPGTWVWDETALPNLWSSPCVAGSAGVPKPALVVAGQAYSGSGHTGARDLCSFLHYRAPRNDELLRCFELLQRTNRLHCIEWRPTLSELVYELGTVGMSARVGLCRDSTGDYGLACFALVQKYGDATLVKSLAFSCRLMNRAYPWYFADAVRSEFLTDGLHAAAVSAPSVHASPMALALARVALGVEVFASRRDDVVTVLPHAKQRAPIG